MSKMFERTEINGMVLANRFVRSATWEGMAADDGAVTPKLVETMAALARGGVGLIISSHAYVLPEGQAGPWQIGVYKDELVPGLREMAAAVHDCGGRIVMQISHAGMFAPPKLTGQAPLVVSELEEPGKTYRPITEQYIRDLVAAFADGARRVKAAGFDGVQIHSAHGYLLSQFLSPLYNRRRDEYGGDIKNRSRIHMEVYRAVREAVGQDYPVLIKLNCRDFAENGLSLEDSLQVGRMLADAGLDAIELSGGLLTGGKLAPSRPGIKPGEEEAYFREEARSFKKAIGIPLILVGGIRSFQVAERLAEDGVADYISLSRPLIREPDLINRWKSGDLRPSECKSDNRCFITSRAGSGMYCETKDSEKEA
ncbi:MAG: NADH:flavin oxidoreductase [Peptococcaceae bacterium]|nr:NADH:flavin oxidoreductase [Peptococcaceae bacterium]